MRNWKPYCSVEPRVLKGIAFAALLAGLVPGRTFALGEPPPEQSAYTEMLRADRMFKAEDFTGARIAYGAAIDLFAALREQQPDYKPAILQHRLEYCRQQLEGLPKETPPPTPGPEPESVEPPTAKAPPAEPVPDVAGETAAAPEPVEPERSIEQREQDLRRREEALKVSLVGLQLERDRMRESVKQIEAERDLALRMLEDAGRKAGPAVTGDAERLADVERKLAEAEPQAARARKLERDNETLREQYAAARDRIAWLTDETETLKAALRAKPAEEPEAAPKAAGEPAPEAVVAAPGAEIPAEDRSEALAAIEAWIEAGRLDQAAEACRAILAEDPDHVDAGYGLARIDWKNGNRRAARKAAIRLSAAAPDRGDLQFFCGEVLLEENELRRALGCFEAAVASDSSSAAYRKALAEGYVEAGRLEDALVAFGALSELDPGDGSAQYNRAALIVKSGDEDRIPEARAAYRKAIELGEPRNAILDRVLEGGPDE